MIIKGGGDAAASGGGGSSPDVNLVKIGGTAQSGANVVDVPNTALRVNAVAGTVTANAGSGTFAVSGTVSVSNFPATQPVSGTVTANIGTTNGLALDATLTGGTAVAILKTSAKGTTASGNPTSDAVDGNTQALNVILKGTNAVTANAGTNLNTSALALESGGNLATIAGKDFATQATLALVKAKTDNLDVLLSTRLKPADTLAGVTTVAAVTSITNPVAVTGTFWQATQPVSAASLPLPAGAATSAKQPALGTAGSAAADVITVQGIASMTALKVDGSGVTQPVSGSVSVSNFPATQPVSGTVTANQGTANATPWNENVAQFGGNAVVTGTGASGSGIPRVTVANDSNVLATQSGTWNIGTVTTLTGITNALPSGTNVIGHVIVDSGSITANAGTNLNTSALALESGGNLALVKAKTDNLDVLLSSRLKPADTLAGVTTVAAVTSITNALPAGSNVIGHVIVDSGSITANAGTNLNTSALALESGGNLATIAGKDFATSAKQDTGNTTLTQIDTDLADLRIVQGATNSTQRGPLMMGVASDTPVSYIDGQIQPLSLTSEGRLRVAATASDMDRIWVTTFDNPWDSTWFPAVGEELSYV